MVVYNEHWRQQIWALLIELLSTKNPFRADQNIRRKGFLAPTGAQGVTMSVCLFGTKCSIFNLLGQREIRAVREQSESNQRVVREQ